MLPIGTASSPGTATYTLRPACALDPASRSEAKAIPSRTAQASRYQLRPIGSLDRGALLRVGEGLAVPAPSPRVAVGRPNEALQVRAVRAYGLSRAPRPRPPHPRARRAPPQCAWCQLSRPGVPPRTPDRS